MQRSDKSPERYRASAEDRPATVRNNISALRLLIRTVHPGNPNEQNSSVLTDELIRQFERIRLAAVKTEPERRRTRTSIRSYVVQARSIVAPRKMGFYDDLTLPDLSGFRSEKVDAKTHEVPCT